MVLSETTSVARMCDELRSFSRDASRRGRCKWQSGCGLCLPATQPALWSARLQTPRPSLLDSCGPGLVRGTYQKPFDGGKDNQQDRHVPRPLLFEGSRPFAAARGLSGDDRRRADRGSIVFGLPSDLDSCLDRLTRSVR